MYRRILILILLLAALAAALPAAAETAARDARTSTEVNVRKAPSTRADIAFILQPGTDVRVTEILDDGDVLWCHVTVTGYAHDGYVLENLLDFAPEITGGVTDRVRGAGQAAGPAVQVDAAYVASALASPLPDARLDFPPETLGRYETLRAGDRGDEVLALKRRLYELGYFTKAPSGLLYTESTAEAVARFRRVNGLDEDGTADPLTQALLYSDAALGPETETDAAMPILLREVRSVIHEHSTALQLRLLNNTRQTITGIAAVIVPYDTWGMPVQTAPDLLSASRKVYTLDGLRIGPKSSYRFASDGAAWVIVPGRFFAGALTAVVSYTCGSETVVIPPESLSWTAIGNADPSAAQAPAPVIISRAARESAAARDPGAEVTWLLPAWRVLYGAPEGALVTRVRGGSAAEKAGLAEGDVLICVGGRPVTGADTLVEALSAPAEDAAPEWIFWRDGVYYATVPER